MCLLLLKLWYCVGFMTKRPYDPRGSDLVLIIKLLCWASSVLMGTFNYTNFHKLDFLPSSSDQ
jgi:hypothetical protein